MRFLSIILSIGILFTSCSTVKKSFSNKKEKKEIVTNHSVDSVTKKTKDSTGSTVSISKTEEKIDSNYKKVTVIEEYIEDYTDEEDSLPPYEPTNPVKPSDYDDYQPKKKKPVYIRKTTITETGVLTKEKKEETGEQKTTSIQSSDSSGKTNKTNIAATVETIEESGSKSRITILSYWWILIIIAVAWSFYRRYHNKSIIPFK